MRTSGEGDFSGEAKVEFKLSDGFSSGPERGPVGGEDAFSLLASVADMMDATRRDGRRLDEKWTAGVKHADDDLFLCHGQDVPG